MKKILFLFAILFMVGVVNAQTYSLNWWQESTNHLINVSDSIFTLNSGKSYYAPLPVSIISDKTLTSKKLDTLLAGGSLVLTNAKKYIYRDSLKLYRDTVQFDFGSLWDKNYFEFSNPNATADTVIIQRYSTTKGGWTQYEVGLRDLLTDNLESNNAMIIIPALTTKKWEANELRGAKFLIGTLTNRVRTSTITIAFIGVNP